MCGLVGNRGGVLGKFRRGRDGGNQMGYKAFDRNERDLCLEMCSNELKTKLNEVAGHTGFDHDGCFSCDARVGWCRSDGEMKVYVRNGKSISVLARTML